MEAYKDKSQPIEKRAEDLIKRMTLEEKLAQLCSDLPVRVMSSDDVGAALQKLYPHGLGRFTQYSMLGLRSYQDIARASNGIQRYFVQGTRLGIPVMLQSESLSGYPGRDGTIFPSMLNLAATFRPQLIEEMGEAIARECMAVGIRQVLSPVLDVSRDPRWGRTYETYGEDTYLVTQMGLGHVKGLQKNKCDGVLATAKHFLGYSETEGGRNTAPTRLGDRELYEVFATPFEAAIKEANLASVMTSYSEIDGIPCGANKKIVRKLLRETMGFDGLVVSDGAAVRRLSQQNHIARDYAEAGLLGITGGMETEMPVGDSYRGLGKYIESGDLDMAVVDEAVRHVLLSKFEAGLFEQPYIDESAVKVFEAKPYRKLSQDIAAESIILLQNEDNLLPLKKGKRLAVIGPHSVQARAAMPGYTVVGYYEMIGTMLQNDQDVVSFMGVADAVQEAGENKAPKIEIGAGTAKTAAEMAGDKRQQLLQGLMADPEEVLRDEYDASLLTEALGLDFEVKSAKGCDIMGDDTAGFASAVEAAKASDVVVLTLGGNCGWVNVTGGEGKDRSGIGLPGVQQQLLDAVAATGKEIVLVLFGPGIYAPRLPQNVKAVLNAFLPGPGAATAVAQVLAGQVNPGGKLPVTVPRSSGQALHYYNHKPSNGLRVEGGNGAIEAFNGGYTDEDDAPLYSFGHGLSYTSFVVGPLEVDAGEVQVGDDIVAHCTVTNTGARAGSEVVQLYYHDAEARVTRPVLELVGFQKMVLQPGECKRVTFRLSTAQLGFYNEDMDFVVEPGCAELYVGNSSANLSPVVKVQLTGQPMPVMGRRMYTCLSEVSDI